MSGSDGARRAEAFARAYPTYVLTTHEGADADGIGAEMILASALESAGAAVLVANSEGLKGRYAFMDPRGRIVRWDASAYGARVRGAGLFVLDASDELTLGPSGEALRAAAADTFYVDHHDERGGSGLEGWLDPSASSTCEMALELARSLGYSPGPDEAKAALAGIVYDTGSFAYPKTGPRTLRAALALLEAGADPAEVHRELNQHASLESLLLRKRVTASLELFEGGRVAFQVMLRSDLEAAGAEYEDAERLVDGPLEARRVEVSVLVKEDGEGRLRCSMRSKGGANVARIAQAFGGGGHQTAAGFRSGAGLAQVKYEVLQEIAAALGGPSHGER